MSVINVTKMWSKIGGSISCEKADALDQKYSFTEGYQVLTDPDTSEFDVMNAVGIPLWGQQHSNGLLAFVTNKNANPLGPIFWVVVVSYDGESPDNSVDVEWTDSTTTEPIDRDINGRAIMTVNLEPVEGLSMGVDDQVVVISRKFLTINTASIAGYRRATNSDTFLGWAPGTARLIGFSAKNRFKYGAPQEQWDVTARIQFRQPYANTTNAQAWYKRWRHEGLMVKTTDVFGTFTHRAVDEFNQEKTKPVLLKLDGTEETNPDNAYFFHTQVYDSLPYAGLGLL